MFTKIGEAIEISKIENPDSCIPDVNKEILENFGKFASNMKKVAPRAEDFLYFSAVMMHAAEASALYDDGTPRLTSSGEAVRVGWDKAGGTFKWVSNDPSVMPYRNSNGDIFPEEELIKAYKKWKDKPLCIDHKSSSVDHVRGFIVDTYYDRNLKRVVALCALDKVGFPQLARQISTGVSNSVSMGTAVGRAICTDCSRVARTEQDFCHHMKTKSSYGEINVDLNPIELSIVVNGADPKANIKHIIAAANTMNAYLDNRNKELAKLASSYSATIIRTPNGQNNQKGNTESMDSIDVRGEDLESFKNDIERGLKELESLKNSEKDTNDAASNLELDTPAADLGLAPPHERYASSEEVDVNLINELHGITQIIEAKLSQMKESLDKLATASTKQEETMSGTNDMNKKAYFQGGGGVNEPTPGQTKYPKDSMQEDLRNSGDKHMVGQSPFPEVGSVDGMHPSPDSAETSNELDRKKMLARAEAEERAAKRASIVNQAKKALETRAYYQGGGGVNEPTPGKVKYPVDKTEYDLREKSDKQMVGQKPFPGVGAVDGLHPSPESADDSDELKRKQKLSRAGLHASFQPSFRSNGTQDLGKTAWNVYVGEKLLLTASVDQLSNGQSDKMYDSIATKEFGTKLLEKVRTAGADKVSAIIKGAQAAEAPAAPAAPAAPEAAPEAGPEAAQDNGSSGDPKAAAADLAEKVRDLSSDLVEAVRALTGEQAEMGQMDQGDMAAAASFSASTMHNIRKDLNSSLIHAMKESIASLNDHGQELEMVSSLDNVSPADRALVDSIVTDSLTEAKTALAEGFNLMTAFVKYARGTAAIVKRAEIEAELQALSDGDDMSSEHDAESGEDDLMAMISDTNSDLDDIKGLMSDDSESDHEDHDEDLSALLGDDVESESDDVDANNLTAKPEELKDLSVKPGTEVTVTAGLESKASRAALRAKLAADALGKEDDGEIQDMSKAKFSDMLDQADGLADGGFLQSETKSQGDLARFETLPEQNKRMMEVAKAPAKVRKEAEAIHRLVTAGKLDVSDLDALVAEGLDKDAVSYYKAFYGEVDGGSEFASELTKEHVKAAMEQEINTYKVKLARAWELANDMVSRGLCHSDRNAVNAQVEEIMTFNDEAFGSLKTLVARSAPRGMQKAAGRMPQVGVIDDSELRSEGSTDLLSELTSALSKAGKRSF